MFIILLIYKIYIFCYFEYIIKSSIYKNKNQVHMIFIFFSKFIECIINLNHDIVNLIMKKIII